eukprot:SAG22_NODE_6994_length_787_cov_1.184593_1_plen_107_part_00
MGVPPAAASPGVGVSLGPADRTWPIEASLMPSTSMSSCSSTRANSSKSRKPSPDVSACRSSSRVCSCRGRRQAARELHGPSRSTTAEPSERGHKRGSLQRVRPNSS